MEKRKIFNQLLRTESLRQIEYCMHLDEGASNALMIRIFLSDPHQAA
jgi:hypothetical protein